MGGCRGRGSQTWLAGAAARASGPQPRAAESVGLGGAQERSFLTSSQVLPPPPRTGLQRGRTTSDSSCAPGSIFMYRESFLEREGSEEACCFSARAAAVALPRRPVIGGRTCSGPGESNLRPHGSARNVAQHAFLTHQEIFRQPAF